MFHEKITTSRAGLSRLPRSSSAFQLAVPVDIVYEALPGLTDLEVGPENQGRAALPPGLGGRHVELQAGLLGQPVGLLQVAGDAGGDDVGPVGGPAAAARDHVVQVEV